MKIIVGLGNPGREYAATRHNLGFMVANEIARRLSAGDRRSRFRAELIEAFDGGEKIVLVKPQTYMNLSGSSVREAVRWYKIPTEDLLVVADDIELPFGTLRLRAAGGSGGHNGLKSIFSELGTQDVPRLRIGVGRGRGDATRQVLSRFSQEEERALPDLVRSAADCALEWERHGVNTAMNRCNRRPEAIAETDSPARTVSGPADSPPTAPKPEIGNVEPLSAPAQPRIAGAYNRARAWWKRQSTDVGGRQRD